MKKLFPLFLVMGAAIGVGVLAFVLPMRTEAPRTQITLQEYCQKQVPAIKAAQTGNTSDFLDLARNLTPFKADGQAQVENVLTNRGFKNIVVASRTFVPVCDPRVSAWTSENVFLVETGATLVAIEDNLDDAEESGDVTQQREALRGDFSIRSDGIEFMIGHLFSAHDLALKGKSNGRPVDSEVLQALKRDALDDLVIE